LKSVDGIVVVGTNQIPFFEQYVDRSKIHFVPHGIDTDFFCPDASVAKDPHKVLFVGNWLRDFDTLIDVAAILAKDAPQVSIDVVTLERNKPLFEGCSNINFFSGIPEDELLRKYREASLLFVPMKDCTANNSVLEGMACGLPIVTTDIGGIRDYVDDKCAVLSPLRDARKASALVIELLGQHERARQMGISSHMKAREFSWPSVSARMMSAYKSAFEKN
jgi:glycosyltransferase involved in cell wall biosynthesis